MSNNQTKISKIVVDHNLCIGCGTCTTIAPGVFKLDENNKSTVIDLNGADADTVLLAAQSCPVMAISVYDEDGKQILP